jgi:hypothetical protein
MGPHGNVGASLRAFREFCKNAHIYGADVDKRVLFEEDRITTFFLDQTDLLTFKALPNSLPDDIDLFIDDGLHSPHANILSLQFGLERIRVGGWVVIEDIANSAAPVWHVVAGLLPTRFKPYLIQTEYGILFAVHKVN